MVVEYKMYAAYTPDQVLRFSRVCSHDITDQGGREGEVLAEQTPLASNRCLSALLSDACPRGHFPLPNVPNVLNVLLHPTRVLVVSDHCCSP